jgi:hypothetical protein
MELDAEREKLSEERPTEEKDKETETVAKEGQKEERDKDSVKTDNPATEGQNKGKV